MSKTDKKIRWYVLALMSFTSVWGFGNVINGFSQYGGLKAVIPWIIVFVLYFIPYVLMVGELGSVFRDSGGGVKSWIDKTIGKKLAYYAGFTYFIVHLPYISQKPNATVISLSWAFFQNNQVNHMNVVLLQIICLAVFLLAVFLSTKGISIIKTVSSVAGMCVFILSILFIVMMFAAPAITHNSSLIPLQWNWETFKPTLDIKFFTGLSILIFAVGGSEKLSPYVNKTENPSKDFSKGMIALAVMVCISAVLGTIATGMMVDSNHIPEDFMTNGAYYAFQKLGEFYHLGNALLIFYAIVNAICQFAVLIISIDAPLRMLLDDMDDTYIPKALLKKNKNGTYPRGILLITIVSGLLIIIPAFGMNGVNEIFAWMIKLNSVCMPLRYLWVFVAYIAMKVHQEKFDAEYRFTKRKPTGIVIGGWCFLVTAVACLMGIFNTTDTFTLIMNIATPFFFVALGLIMPSIASHQKKKEQKGM